MAGRSGLPHSNQEICAQDRCTGIFNSWISDASPLLDLGTCPVGAKDNPAWLRLACTAATPGTICRQGRRDVIRLSGYWTDGLPLPTQGGTER